MTTTAHTIRCARGPETVEATSPAPGLYVYEIPAHVDTPSPYRWRIGHHSGRVIAAAMYEDDALRGAAKIADLADWTKTTDELRASVTGLADLYEALAWASCEHPALV